MSRHVFDKYIGTTVKLRLKLDENYEVDLYDEFIAEINEDGEPNITFYNGRPVGQCVWRYDSMDDTMGHWEFDEIPELPDFSKCLIERAPVKIKFDEPSIAGVESDNLSDGDSTDDENPLKRIKLNFKF
jgi:hypothetical protein